MSAVSASSSRAAPASLAAVMDAVRRHWGFDTLRPLQTEAIQAELDGRDSVVVMPTGGGKSLCYQAPALVSGRMTVVVSPLIALMKDQVDALRLMGCPAAALHSHISNEDAATIREQVTAGETRLLFVAPERLLSGGFLNWLRGLKGPAAVGGIAIDEAHCISQWGHDFRPEYRRLAELRSRFPGVALHAYTATATPRVRDDIAAQLALRDPAMLVGRFDRPNLTYRAVPRRSLVEQVEQVLRRHEDQAAIIYCISRNDTEALAESLRNLPGSRAIDARAYHAGLSAHERTRVQTRFKTERLNVVVATVAFGMGIDRGDVRCVIHAAMPKSIEHYQQETGRAGRDGLAAECALFVSPADDARWKRLMERSAGEWEGEASPEALRAQLDLLAHMRAYCNVGGCRHAALSEYFGQEYEPPEEPAQAPGESSPGVPGEMTHGEATQGAAFGRTRKTCNACDTCLGERAVVADSLRTAQMVLSCVARVKGAFGAAHITDVLRGRATKRVTERRHHELSTFGLLAGERRETVLAYIDQLIEQGALDRDPGEEDRYPTLRLNASSMSLMRGNGSVSLLAVSPPGVDDGKPSSRAERRADAMAALDEGEQALFESLRGLRRGIAQERGVPPYVVFGDAALVEMARVRPGSPTTFITIRGVGQVKVTEFGAQFVDHIRGYCREHGMQLDAKAGSRPRRTPDSM